MSAHLRRARRVLRYEGVSARDVALVLSVDVAEVRNDRRALGRDPEVGGPTGAAVSVASEERHELYDSLMRSNRPVRM